MPSTTLLSFLPLGMLVLGTGAAAQSPQPGTDAAARVRQVAGPGRFPDQVLSLIVGEGSLWLSCQTGGPIWRRPVAGTYRLDPRNLETIAVLPVAGLLAAGEGAVWVRHHPPKVGLLSKIDPRTNRLVATVPLKHGEGERMVAGAGGVWLSGRHEFAPGGHVVRLDPRTNQVAAVIPLDRPVADLAVGEGAVWVLTGGAPFGLIKREVLRLDPRTNRVAARIPVSATTGRVAAGEGWVWAVDGGLGLAGRPTTVVTRINPSTNQVEGSPIPLSPAGVSQGVVAVGGGGLWVPQYTRAARQPYQFSFVDARRRQTRELPASTSHRLVVAVAVGDQAVWVASHSATGGSVLDRVQP